MITQLANEAIALIPLLIVLEACDSCFWLTEIWPLSAYRGTSQESQGLRTQQM